MAIAGLTHWEPFRALRRREDAFEDLLRDFFGRGEGGSDTIEPPMEVAEVDGEVLVKMMVPGVEKDQLNISVADNMLSVRGESRKESEEKNKNYFRQEIRYGVFERSVRLPTEVDASKATADIKNGMLRITLPKSKAPKAQQIKVGT